MYVYLEFVGCMLLEILYWGDDCCVGMFWDVVSLVLDCYGFVW